MYMLRPKYYVNRLHYNVYIDLHKSEMKVMSSLYVYTNTAPRCRLTNRDAAFDRIKMLHQNHFITISFQHKIVSATYDEQQVKL